MGECFTYGDSIVSVHNICSFNRTMNKYYTYGDSMVSVYNDHVAFIFNLHIGSPYNPISIVFIVECALKNICLNFTCLGLVHHFETRLLNIHC